MAARVAMVTPVLQRSALSPESAADLGVPLTPSTVPEAGSLSWASEKKLEGDIAPEATSTEEVQTASVAADPLADVLDWLGRAKYDMRENSRPSAASTSVSEDAPMLDICEESPHRGGPAHAHASRQLLPKLDKVEHATGGLRSSKLGDARRSAVPPSGGGNERAGGASGGVAACASSTKCLASHDARAGRDLVEEEEEEWEMRQRKSGTVGRLVVYNKGERPKEDIVLRGGGRRHVVVAGVREGGQAARTGVRAGDRLVSIDGRKDFLGLPADAVRERLCAPTVLVFLGFVGKLQAEVRLTNADHICGISARREVLRGSFDAPVTLCEERIFNVGLASLFLTVTDRPDEAEEAARPETAASVDWTSSTTSPSNKPLFELQRSEAHGLVKRALRRLEVDQQEGVLPASLFPRPKFSNSRPLEAATARVPGFRGSQTHLA